MDIWISLTIYRSNWAVIWEGVKRMGEGKILPRTGAMCMRVGGQLQYVVVIRLPVVSKRIMCEMGRKSGKTMENLEDQNGQLQHLNQLACQDDCILRKRTRERALPKIFWTPPKEFLVCSVVDICTGKTDH